MEKKRRILHLTYDMGVGGTEQVITQLVQNLDADDYENSIACIDGQIGLLGENLGKQGIEFHVFERVPGFDTNLIKAIRATLKSNDIDIVHCHQYTPYVYGVLAALFTSVKVVFTEHGRFHPDSFSWKRRMINPLLGMATDSIVAISKATAQALAHYEWFSLRSIQVIYNGIVSTGNETRIDHRDELQINPGDIVFGTIARFDTIKNLPMMIEAFRELKKVHDNARLLLVGDGGEREKLEAMVEEYDLGNEVIFTGYQKDTAKYMSVIDVYLLTSYSEGTSMTLLEALSMGVCSIVTAVGGNVEIVEHNVNGIVVKSEDVADLSAWMIKLSKDTEQRKKLGDAGKGIFNEKFSIEKMTARYSDIYTRILS